MVGPKKPLSDTRMPPNEWLEVLSQKWHLPPIDLAHYDYDPAVLGIFPRDFVAKHYVFPVNVNQPKDRKDEVLIVAMADPGDDGAKKQAEFLASRSLVVVVTTHESIERAIAKHYDRREP